MGDFSIVNMFFNNDFIPWSFVLILEVLVFNVSFIWHKFLIEKLMDWNAFKKEQQPK